MKFIYSLLLTVITLQVSAQNPEEKAIKATIDQFFNGMRMADSGMIAATISSTAVFQTIVPLKDGTVEVRSEAVADFLQSVGKPHKELYDEQIQYGAIHIDATLASVWTPYKFYLGKTFSHCGVNSFQLVKINNIWKIQYIIDTRRKDACVAGN
ncbi:hypothetical protein [Flavihumibacter fluvii]|uniref:hypothetical protein n=1 Tax=Flavihumibacter fluvii TaxID=2838157 RepID=UPI001BDF5D50|nr:hypothetical protein [Flavihumibacter fluvii]ULQ53886.1 hypothetical protein KJS93_06075 [Flavihumibacter fluvii]